MFNMYTLISILQGIARRNDMLPPTAVRHGHIDGAVTYSE